MNPESFNWTDIDVRNYIVAAFPGYLANVIFGCTSVICNIILILIISKGKSTVGNFRLTAIHLSIAECFLAICLLIIGLNRIQPSLVPYDICSVVVTLVFSAIAAVYGQSFCLALDRFLGIFYPIWYRNISSGVQTRNPAVLNILMWILAASIGAVQGSLGLTNEREDICAVHFMFTTTSYTIYLALISVIAFATLVCYLLILFRSIWCVQQTTITPQRESSSVSKTIVIIVACHFSFSILMALGGIGVAQLPNSFAATPYLSSLGPINGTITLPLYIFYVKSVREDFLYVFECCLKRKAKEQRNIQRNDVNFAVLESMDADI